MVRAAVALFLVGLFSLFLGLYGVAGFTLELGRLLLIVFLLLSALSFAGGLVARSKHRDDA